MENIERATQDEDVSETRYVAIGVVGDASHQHNGADFAMSSFL